MDELDELNDFGKFEGVMSKINKMMGTDKNEDKKQGVDKGTKKDSKADNYTSKEQKNIMGLFKDGDIDRMSNKKELNDDINTKASKMLDSEVNRVGMNNICSKEIMDTKLLLMSQIEGIDDPKEKLKKYSEAMDTISALVGTEVAEMNDNSKKYQSLLKEAIISEAAGKDAHFAEKIRQINADYTRIREAGNHKKLAEISGTNAAREAAERESFIKQMTGGDSKSGGSGSSKKS